MDSTAAALKTKVQGTAGWGGGGEVQINWTEEKSSQNGSEQTEGKTRR